VNLLFDFRVVPLFADAGIPMIFITFPGMLALLLPIIAAEAAFVIHRTSFNKKKVIWTTALGNALSTVIGIPFTWGALVLGEMGLFEGIARTRLGSGNWNGPLAQIVATILSAPWLAPVGSSASWAVPLATLVLLIPFFLASVWIEQRVMEHFLPVTMAVDPQPGEVNERVLRCAVRDANLMSYGFLFAFATVWLLWGSFHR
jgi:hypothetical protein